VAKLDLVAAAGVALAAAPLYLAALYRWPVQVGSDEQAIMLVSDQYADAEDVDPFGLTGYWDRPALLFLFWGRAAQLIGGIDLFELRLLHALVGLLVIAASYALFRQLLPRRWAMFSALLLALSHSFLMISRMAMRENTAVLVEVVALALLIWGLRHDHAFATFCGGFVAGLGFYVYHPGRAAFPLWVLFLVMLALLYRQRFPLRKLARLGSIAAAGFVLMAAPVLIAESKSTLPPGDAAPRAQLLIYSDAREVQKNWVNADSEWEGIKKNISFGLTTFNSDVVDHGWIYENRGHGFVDPLTGILLWIGVGVVGWRLLRRRDPPWAMLALGSFVFLWLSFAFLVNKAPNYTRLLIVLPFVAYLVTEAVRAIGLRVERRYGFRRAVPVVAVSAVAAIGVWNLAIAWDFIDKGRKEGEPIGSTGRYVEAHRDTPGQKSYLSADEDAWKYFVWGNDQQRVQLFAHEGQVGPVVAPASLGSFTPAPPFAIFMRRDLFATAESNLTTRYPEGRLRDITPDGRLVVFEVPRSA
jgi:4-amino-4-deoxy-L-arabinose transferase-like glycosyltransferase